jgi:hypothetical protein
MAAVRTFCLTVGLIPCLSLTTMLLLLLPLAPVPLLLRYLMYFGSTVRTPVGAALLCNNVCLCHTDIVCDKLCLNQSRQCTSLPLGKFVSYSPHAMPVVMSTFSQLFAHRTRLCLFCFLLLYKQLKLLFIVSCSVLC